MQILPLILMFVMFGPVVLTGVIFVCDYVANSDWGIKIGLADDPRTRLTKFYKKHNPNKMRDVRAWEEESDEGKGKERRNEEERRGAQREILDGIKYYSFGALEGRHEMNTRFTLPSLTNALLPTFSPIVPRRWCVCPHVFFSPHLEGRQADEEVQGKLRGDVQEARRQIQ